MSDYPLVIIGAGAAGLGASEQASRLGLAHIVLEAAHRIGGRGLTEMLGGKYPVDLGCHWMHSASLNPYVGWADQLGFDYSKNQQTVIPQRDMHFHGKWLGAEDRQDYETFEQQFNERVVQSASAGQDCSVFDLMEIHDMWTPYQAYWLSLMHSNDPDQVSIKDIANYVETHEDWPVKQGYGALICEQGRSCPIALNTVVSEIQWQSGKIRIKTNKGEIRADKVIITVSTGILGAGDIKFTPPLPVEKQDAIAGLPLGNYNNLFFEMTSTGFVQSMNSDESIRYSNGEQSLALNVKPFSYPYVFGCTAGRFAWWLEKQEMAASEDYLKECLVNIFGADIKSSLGVFKASAWGFDPWVKGAYSSARPGLGHIRSLLATPLDERLFFAGEATSLDAFNTAHGAYLSGRRAVEEVSSCGVERG